MIELVHGGRDAASFRLVFALAELDLPHAEQRINLMALEQWSEPLRALSGGGAVPVLIDGALVMDDGPVALLYLAEILPEAGLLPAEPIGRYDVQSLQDRLDGLMLDSVNAVGWHQTTEPAERDDYLRRLECVPGRQRLTGWSAVWRDAIAPENRLAEARSKLSRGIACIEQALDSRDWLVGDQFSVADIAAFALARPVPELMPESADRKTAPRFTAWLERVGSRPGCRRALDAAPALKGLSPFAPPRWVDSD